MKVYIAKKCILPIFQNGVLDWRSRLGGPWSLDRFFIRLPQRTYVNLMESCSEMGLDDIPTHALISLRTGIEQNVERPKTIIHPASASTPEHSSSLSFSGPNLPMDGRED